MSVRETLLSIMCSSCGNYLWRKHVIVLYLLMCHFSFSRQVQSTINQFMQTYTLPLLWPHRAPYCSPRFFAIHETLYWVVRPEVWQYSRTTSHSWYVFHARSFQNICKSTRSHIAFRFIQIFCRTFFFKWWMRDYSLWFKTNSSIKYQKTHEYHNHHFGQVG